MPDVVRKLVMEIGAIRVRIEDGVPVLETYDSDAAAQSASEDGAWGQVAKGDEVVGVLADLRAFVEEHADPRRGEPAPSPIPIRPPPAE